MNNYTSSIINLYGDNDKVREDSKVLKDILDRQGTTLLLHVIANHVGSNAYKYDLTQGDVTRLKDSLTSELRNSINERT
jgi:hypothetical protein